jgi:DNA-nicking Smr family endonuclease
MTDEPFEIPIEDRIDLHTFQPKEIPSLVEEYLSQATARGFSQVRIIHGRGKGIQRAVVQRILRSHPAVLDIEDAPDLGATVAYLKSLP